MSDYLFESKVLSKKERLKKQLRLISNHPVILINLIYSFFIRLIYGLNIFQPFQLVVDWRSRFVRKRGSKVIIRGQFFVGGRYITNLSSSSANVLIYDGGTLIINGRVKIGPGVQIVVARGGKLIMNNGTYITADAKIFCSSTMEIGKNCAISWGTSIIDSDFHQLYYEGRKTEDPQIKIGDNVWIGCNSTILKGVKISSNTVIAAGSVVTKDLPSSVLAGGNPAKVLKENISWK
ncbi:acyltransferase [Anaerobranca gottschalkii]|uniref:Transferase hexapeptide (Six repeat-containing protein) n=1 Tax=Anaerobranca gottschalkii DSM 13577 TaxID=1120990 RepID=A0A1I0A884_9FIRM|nr:acyltransferase [Anaerobranca gottschalkii]SES90355.1 transferase hexapeptide (six repeat-containing protein) [Anaerobranca gottschalkii DSM 13577]